MGNLHKLIEYGAFATCRPEINFIFLQQSTFYLKFNQTL